MIAQFVNFGGDGDKIGKCPQSEVYIETVGLTRLKITKTKNRVDYM